MRKFAHPRLGRYFHIVITAANNHDLYFVVFIELFSGENQEIQTVYNDKFVNNNQSIINIIY